MALAQRVTTPPAPTVHGTPCSVGVLVATLPDEERAALLLMLGTTEQPGWTAGDIYDAVTGEGHKIGFQTINRHRGKRCRCYRVAA